jgi:hypothetical protein
MYMMFSWLVNDTLSIVLSFQLFYTIRGIKVYSKYQFGACSPPGSDVISRGPRGQGRLGVSVAE